VSLDVGGVRSQLLSCSSSSTRVGGSPNALLNGDRGSGGSPARSSNPCLGGTPRSGRTSRSPDRGSRATRRPARFRVRRGWRCGADVAGRVDLGAARSTDAPPTLAVASPQRTGAPEAVFLSDSAICGGLLSDVVPRMGGFGRAEMFLGPVVKWLAGGEFGKWLVRAGRCTCQPGRTGCRIAVGCAPRRAAPAGTD